MVNIFVWKDASKENGALIVVFVIIAIFLIHHYLETGNAGALTGAVGGGLFSLIVLDHILTPIEGYIDDTTLYVGPKRRLSFRKRHRVNRESIQDVFVQSTLKRYTHVYSVNLTKTDGSELELFNAKDQNDAEEVVDKIVRALNPN